MNARKTMRRIRNDVTSLKPGMNWLTTLAGIMAAAGSATPFLPPPYNAYAGAAGAVGVALLGLSARQANVSSDDMHKGELPKAPEIKQP